MKYSREQAMIAFFNGEDFGAESTKSAARKWRIDPHIYLHNKAIAKYENGEIFFNIAGLFKDDVHRYDAARRINNMLSYLNKPQIFWFSTDGGGWWWKNGVEFKTGWNKL